MQFHIPIYTAVNRLRMA